MRLWTGLSVLHSFVYFYPPNGNISKTGYLSMTPPLTFVFHPLFYPFWSFRHKLTMYPRKASNLRKFSCLSLPSDRLKVMSHYSWPPLTNVVPDQLLLVIFFFKLCMCSCVDTSVCMHVEARGQYQISSLIVLYPIC